MRICGHKLVGFLRPTTVRRLCVVGLLILVVFVFPVSRYVISVWSAESRTIGDQLFAGLVIILVVAVSRGLFSKRSVVVPWFAIARDILRFSNAQLKDGFEIIGNAQPIPFGYKTYGGRQSSATSLTYKTDSDREQTASALFKPVVKREKHGYWRAGIALWHGEVELVKFHIDNSQFVLLLVDGKRSFRYVWPHPFNNRWHRLRLSVSPQQGGVQILCYLDATLVGVHSVPTAERKFFPIFQAWSDRYGDHLVYIRDIWVQQGGVVGK